MAFGTLGAERPKATHIRAIPEQYKAVGTGYSEYVAPWAEAFDEDRIGYFVTAADGFLSIADAGDFVLGVTTGAPAMAANVGDDGTCDRDDFGRVVARDVAPVEWDWKTAPTWTPVALVGVVAVRDDGTCQVGSWATCGAGGKATIAKRRGYGTYMVIDRIADDIVRVVLT